MKLSLGKKIAFGFASSLVLTLLIGGVGYYALERVKKGSLLYQSISETQIVFKGAKEALSQYMMNRFQEGRQQQKAAFSQSMKLFSQCKELMLAQREKSEGDAFREACARNGEMLEKYITKFKALNQAETVLIEIEPQLNDTMKQVDVLLASDLFLAKDLIRDTKILFAEGTKYVLRKDEEVFLSIKSMMDDLEPALKKWRGLVENADDLRAVADQLQVLFAAYSDLMSRYHDGNNDCKAALQEMTRLEKELQDGFTALGDMALDAMHTVQERAKVIIVIGVAVAFLMGFLVAFFIIRGITHALGRITEGMRTGAEQVASASVQVASSSQSMAVGASEQAASIEETSSSMEEMASMTRKNAEHATQANILMKTAQEVVEKAEGTMDRLTQSMADITKASEDTSRIIKTIDEIAFQTNLLALNAAVEAARAGEAGAGFAVVADEVRNLAMRAAEAAKDTESLIEETLGKVHDGSRLLTDTNDAFVEISKSSGKVGRLIFEIAEASNEQTGGIDQVNVAIAEVDGIVQKTAAGAEQSAAAAEEMKKQARQLEAYVDALIQLVTGHSQSRKTSVLENERIAVKAHSPRPVPVGKIGRKNEIRADQLIPFDEDMEDNGDVNGTF